MGAAALLGTFALDVLAKASPDLEQDAADLLTWGFGQLVAAIKSSTLKPQGAPLALQVAAGVIAQNPTANPQWVCDEVVEAVRILVLNSEVDWSADLPTSVNALATVALIGAGWTGPFPPKDPTK